jgi:hypothetical protein
MSIADHVADLRAWVFERRSTGFAACIPGLRPLPISVPSFQRRAKCGKCGVKSVDMRPHWRVDFIGNVFSALAAVEVPAIRRPAGRPSGGAEMAIG